MRQIGSIDNETEAIRFGDHLLTKGIKNHIESQSAGGWAIWVEDDDLLDRARGELAQFRTNPADARYDAADKAEKIRKTEERDETRRRRQFIDVRTRWSHPSQLARPVTIALVILSILAGVGTKLSKGGWTPLESALSFVPTADAGNGRVVVEQDLGAIKRGQVWRLVTPIFMHVGIFHLIFNMFWLLDLGSMIETRRGSLRLLLMVLVAAVLSNLAQYYLGHFGRPDPMFRGMSGVVYALFGYAWICGRIRPHLGVGISNQNVTIMLFWLVLCMTGLVGPVANAAHVAGLLLGVFCAYVPFFFTRIRRLMR
jgi:GlpG protein